MEAVTQQHTTPAPAEAVRPKTLEERLGASDPALAIGPQITDRRDLHNVLGKSDEQVTAFASDDQSSPRDTTRPGCARRSARPSRAAREDQLT
jgi:hypothetical protein